MWQDWTWKRNLDFGGYHVMVLREYWQKFFETCCLDFCTNIHFFHKQMNKSQTFCGKCLFTAVSWQGLVRLINSNGGWAKPTISSWPANGHSMFGNHRDISASRHCWGLLYWSNQLRVLWKEKVLLIRAVHVQAYHTKLSKCHIQACITLSRLNTKTCIIKNIFTEQSQKFEWLLFLWI